MSEEQTHEVTEETTHRVTESDPVGVPAPDTRPPEERGDDAPASEEVSGTPETDTRPPEERGDDVPASEEASDALLSDEAKEQIDKQKTEDEVN